jgi:hypothetical protein
MAATMTTTPGGPPRTAERGRTPEWGAQPGLWDGQEMEPVFHGRRDASSTLQGPTSDDGEVGTERQADAEEETREEDDGAQAATPRSDNASGLSECTPRTRGRVVLPAVSFAVRACEHAKRAARVAPLAAKVPPEWRSPVVVHTAARAFDAEHDSHFHDAQRHVRRLARDGTSQRSERRLAKSLFALRANRYSVQPLRLPPLVVDHESPLRSPRTMKLRLASEHTAAAAAAAAATTMATSGSPRPPGASEGGAPSVRHRVGGPWSPRSRVFETDDGFIEEDGTPLSSSNWRLGDSIWSPRRRWADSGDYYDTPDVLLRMIDADWTMARTGGGLDRFLQQSQGVALGGTGDESFESLLERTRAVFWVNQLAFYQIFDHYGTLGQSTDYTHIQFNSYKSMLADWGLIATDAEQAAAASIASEGGTAGDGCSSGGGGGGGAANGGINPVSSSRWDELFVRLNAAPPRPDLFNHKKGINRQEFVQLLVHAACMRYVLHDGRQIDDVPSALELLFEADVLPSCNPEMLDDPSDFRRDHCYTEQTDEVLRKHEPSLRLLYEHAAYGDGAIGGLLSRKLLDLGEWRFLLDRLGLVDWQFEERSVRNTFVRSRMRVVSESASRGRAKLLQLSFEDFCEALVRMSRLKALPTDADVARAQCIDGGEYMLRKKEAGTAAWEAFLESHQPHGSAGTAPRARGVVAELVQVYGGQSHESKAGAPPPAQLEPQPTHRALDHLLSFIMRTITGIKGRDGGLQLSEKVLRPLFQRAER